jgi:hypothetical protein
VFGLTIAADRPIAGLLPRADLMTPDVHVHFERGPAASFPDGDWPTAPFYVSPFRDERGQPRGRAWDMDGGYLRFLTNERAEFVVDRQGTQIWVHAPESSASDIGDYLVGPIFALMLRRRGRFCLHASVVCLEGRALALLGSEGAGKSTLAAVFAMQGHVVVADDLAALIEHEGALFIPRGPAYVRPRTGAVEHAAAMLGLSGRLKRSPDPEFLDLHLDNIAHCDGPASDVDQPVPLAAIYVLDRQLLPSDTCAIDSLSGPEAVLTLLAHSWATRPLARESRGAELDLLTRVAADIPLRRTGVLQRDGDALTLCRRIADDFSRLAAHASLHARA